MTVKIITDMGAPLILDADDGETLNIGRYGVWSDDGRKAEVIATGDDLDRLQSKYGPGLEVVPLTLPAKEDA